jgi:hypothetical protein
VSEIDFRSLLKKYIAHVGEQEGTAFIWAHMHGFTDEEVATLVQLEAELTAEYQASRPS